MKIRGFSLVELIVVITILGILMTVGTFTITNSLSQARDNERKSDAETIALHLENFYKYGADKVEGADYQTESGRYPDTASVSGYTVRLVLRDIDPKSLTAPGSTRTNLKIANFATSPTEASLPTTYYLYQPLAEDSSGNTVICNNILQECRSFNLYYKLENTPPTSLTDCDQNTKICKIESKNQ